MKTSPSVFIKHLQEMYYGRELELPAPQRKKRQLDVAPAKSIQGSNENKNLVTNKVVAEEEILETNQALTHHKITNRDP